MLVLFAVIFGGIVTGRLLQSRRLAFVSRLIAVIIWALLFLLGLEVGSDPAVVGGMATLGRTAFVIFVFSVAGSIGASWLLWRRIRGRTASGTEGAAVNPASAGSVAGRGFGVGGGGCGANGFSGSVADQSSEALPNPAACGASCLPEPSEPALFCAPCSPQSSSAACEPTPAPASPASEPEKPLSMWGALKGSLVIVAFFVAGCLAGLSSALPFDVAGSRLSTYVLYALMFCVGITLGNDTTLAGRVRRLDPRLALLPVMTAVGTLAGAALSTLLLPPLTAGDTMAVGAGFGYYSLSSIFIADFRGAELGTVALLCNVMRELFTLLAAPLVARWFGPLAAVSIGGATTFDTTLPIITQSAGKPYAVVSVFHGCVLDFSVPFLVTFFCTM